MFAPTYASTEIAITVKRSEEVVCSVTIQIDPRLPCSYGAIDKPMPRRVRAFSQRPLAREVIDDLGRGLAADEGREFFHARLGDLLYRTELAQQARLSLISHSGN